MRSTDENRYFRDMDEVIQGHGGYIAAFVGDVLMAIFGIDPHSTRAKQHWQPAQAGLGMMDRVKSGPMWSGFTDDNSMSASASIVARQSSVSSVASARVLQQRLETLSTAPAVSSRPTVSSTRPSSFQRTHTSQSATTVPPGRFPLSSFPAKPASSSLYQVSTRQKGRVIWQWAMTSRLRRRTPSIISPKDPPVEGERWRG